MGGGIVVAPCATVVDHGLVQPCGVAFVLIGLDKVARRCHPLGPRKAVVVVLQTAAIHPAFPVAATRKPLHFENAFAGVALHAVFLGVVPAPKGGEVFLKNHSGCVAHFLGISYHLVVVLDGLFRIYFAKQSLRHSL